MSSADGMSYAPRAAAGRVVEPGAFKVGAIGLDHGHIYGMCHGLADAGAEIVAVYDPDPAKIAAFCKQFPDAEPKRSIEEVLDDWSIVMVASAAVPADRGPLGCRVMDAGKHYFSDKAPFTTTAQLEAAREKTRETGLIWAVCYSERLQSECAIFAGQLIEEGAIGTVLQVIGLGPHRLSAASRPEWFFIRERYGGILIDIGSHQVEQFLFYTGAKDATVLHSKVANYAHPEYPELEDFGDATLVADNGATNYFRVDWFTPDGLSTWGDGRTIILGTDGYIELRKYTDLAREPALDHLYLANGKGERFYDVRGKVGFPYFGALITDCLYNTRDAMSQEHTFKAAELCLKAQAAAVRIDTTPVA
jgi:predicted dehydrogenase